MATPYTITSVTEAYRLNDAGKLELQKVITYKTVYGDTGSVSVSKDNYVAEIVSKMIADEIAETDKLRGMK